jgi:hypothetical protein
MRKGREESYKLQATSFKLRGQYPRSCGLLLEPCNLQQAAFYTHINFFTLLVACGLQLEAYSPIFAPL